ncbi:hypothetical protein MELLADRAFT_94713 [Melampsora larici-populina 98AG31]|uniref:Uncharacterized protein n=1 Tax=Melampsora larici-populina (strain 98AG31 / pathotype 3-4-7) TaxID=747676 RepID=F4S7P9_MELLP|nr:hypothetical protein MELLADRAFT_94713 [Melampsora larici-populina 98AG31]
MKYKYNINEALTRQHSESVPHAFRKNEGRGGFCDIQTGVPFGITKRCKVRSKIR